MGPIGRKNLPKWLKLHLRYTVGSVLPGIIACLLFLPKATGGVFNLPRFWAAAVTLLLGVWTDNLFVAVIASNVTLYSILKIGF